MPSLEVLTGSPSLSFSSMDSFLQCGERYRLEKVVKVQQKRAWYLLGGSAVHTATELVDLEGLAAEDAWATAWAQQLETLAPGEEVRAGGRASKAYPNKEDQSWWEVNGLAQVQSWVAWKDSRIAAGWTVDEVEVGFQVLIGGVPVRGFIDRVMTDPAGNAWVVDLKTGVHSPAGTLQLGIYRHGLLAATGRDAIMGGYYMTRKGDISEPKSLLHYTEDRLADWLGKTRQAIESELFVPHVTSLCGSCSVAPYCAAVGGTPPDSSTL
jgi:putative RecB family exonuclease